MCLVARAVSDILSLTRFVTEVAALSSFAVALRALIQLIQRSPLSKIPRLNLLLVLVITGLVAIDDLISVFLRLRSTIIELQALAEGLASLCSTANPL